jgi:membrane protease subunit (stomatin/prohibitin family)
MGIFGTELRREFIARPDSAKGQILYKWPDRNIRKLSQLTVEQDELAVFFRDGRVQGTVQPGRVTLDSSEIPFLGLLVDAATGGNLFLTELYFISTREFPNLPFGGMIDNVVDPQTNLGVGLRVFGEYSLKVVEPQSLIVNLVGTQNLTTNDQITDWMRAQLLKTMRTDVVTRIVSNGWPLLGIAAHTDQIEGEVIQHVQRNIASYGLQIVRLGNFTITLKPEDEDKLKTYIRDTQYTRLAGGFQQYAAGEAMLGAGAGLAQGPGQGGGNPAFLGVGLGMGGAVAGQAGQTLAAGGQIQVRCPKCHALNAENARFCNSCGQSLNPAAAPVGATLACPKCGTQNAATARFCTNCGESLEAVAAPGAASASGGPGSAGPGPGSGGASPPAP